ncbi:hypothetical protein RMATCC62417_06119 [Rhizopus microsporus]|nr:hypothetical protein RMATCC62417_06119 [Rhizopus microsporus]
MTTTTIHHLPADILDHIFQHTDRTTLKECRLVCVSWYLLTTPHLFRSIQINSTSQIAKFIDFHENPASDQLVPFGKYVKRVTTGEDRGMADTRISLENYETFVKYCPKVTSVSISLTACEGSLYYYLFEVDENIKWKLHGLDRNTEDQTFTLDNYYKYKDTIRVIRWLEDILDFHFVIDFPLLEELALPSTVVITDIQDFMFICNTCSNLTDLDLYTNMNDHTSLMTDFAVCPSLNTLNVRCRSLIPKVLIDYITTSLVNLSNITFWIEIASTQANFSEIYKQLEDFLFTPQKKLASLTLKAEIGHRENYEQIYTMIDECLNVACHSSKLKACNSIQWIIVKSTVLVIDLWKIWNYTIECQVYIPAMLFNGLIRKDAFTSSKMPNFHKLCLEQEFKWLSLSMTVTLFIEKACNLQELTLRWYSVGDTHGCVYESVRILRIEKSIFYPDFIKKFTISFPNLKELHLYKVRMFDSGEYFRDRLLDLGDLNLQKLSFTTNEMFNFSGNPMTQLVCLETKGKCQYIKVCPGGIPKTITNEEGAAVWESMVVNHIHLIMRSVPARFELNNVYIELTI